MDQPDIPKIESTVIVTVLMFLYLHFYNDLRLKY